MNIVLSAVAIATIKSSNRVARAAASQATDTTNLVIAAKDQLDQSREELSESIRPIIAEVPQNPKTDENAVKEGAFVLDPDCQVVVAKHSTFIEVTVPIRNVGYGPAILTGASISVPARSKGEEGVSVDRFDPIVTAIVLPAGAAAHVW
jgi:hypothetical protein